MPVSSKEHWSRESGKMPPPLITGYNVIYRLTDLYSMLIFTKECRLKSGRSVRPNLHQIYHEFFFLYLARNQFTFRNRDLDPSVLQKSHDL